MWNCHSWPLDVSNNLSGYCISNLVLVSAFDICMCIYALVFPYIFLLVDCFKWSLIGHIEKCRVHSALAVLNGGSIISFTFPYIFLLVDCFKWALIGHIEKWRVHSMLWQFWMGEGDISLYILISWPFRMGSHWWHWTAKSWLSALAVLNEWRGDISLYILISWPFRMGSHWQHWTAKSWLSALAVLNEWRGNISLYILISWPFQMGSHWQHWTVKSWLSALAVSNGGGLIVSFTWVNLQIWSPRRLGVLINKVFSLREDQ